MVDLLLLERRISLTALAKRESVNTCTTWRWTSKGVNGIRLESFSIGAKRFTTEEAFSRWIEQVSAARQGEFPKPQTNRQREASIASAERELAEIGI